MAKAKADNKAARKAAETALKGFPRAKLHAAFKTMGATATEAEVLQTDKATAALEVVRLAHTFRTANADATSETVAKGWRDHMATMATTLAKEGNKFAKMETRGEGKEKREVAVLTGYGNNVTSIAKGAIQHDIKPDECTDDDGNVSYRAVRKAVEAARAEERAQKNPEAAALAESKDKADEAWKALRAVVFGSEDQGLIDALTESLEQMAKAETEAQAEQDGAEAEQEQEAA